MDFSKVFERIKENTDIQTLKSLAEIVGCKPQQASRKNKENSFPTDWAFIIGRKYNLSTDWLLTGEGPAKRGSDCNIPKHNFDILNDVEEWLSEIVVNEPHRRDWFKGNLEDAFPMFKEWKKRREEQESETDTSADKKIA